MIWKLISRSRQVRWSIDFRRYYLGWHRQQVSTGIDRFDMSSFAAAGVRQRYICHLCYTDFVDRQSLISHFAQCPTNNTPTDLNDDDHVRLPRLTKTDQQILHRKFETHSSFTSSLRRLVLKLRRLNNKDLRGKSLVSPRLRSTDRLSSSKPPPFDDLLCSTDNFPPIVTEQYEEKHSANVLNTKSSSYHLYKYSRREQRNFYTSVKRARLKKQNVSTRRSRLPSTRAEQGTLYIQLPTRITSRQGLKYNGKNSYPLLFDTNFHSLVALSTENLFSKYSSVMNTYFHLIHSIASQEFQIIVHSHDCPTSPLPYTAVSFLHLLRQTMFDYSRNLQATRKRDYFQAFHHDQQSTLSWKPPLPSLSDPPPPLATRIDHLLPPRTTVDRLNHVEMELTIVAAEPPVTKTVTSTSMSNEVRSKGRTSPLLLKPQKMEPRSDDSLPLPQNGARIRLVNWAFDPENSKPLSRQTSVKRARAANERTDENVLKKPAARVQTRQNSLVNDKQSNLIEILPSLETKPVVLPLSQISQEWATHGVFYRCHACAHEEFFLVLSRECIKLHLSSQHANMEENFKQRLSNFLNNQGRSLKIIQHYLKWQQPWSETDVEQIFQLSNGHTRNSHRR